MFVQNGIRFRSCVPPAKFKCMPEVAIRVARADEHADISELALRSKSYWGYSKEFLDACRDELTFDAAVCASGMAWVAAEGSTLVGVSVITGAHPSANSQDCSSICPRSAPDVAGCC